ncbi:hypothetical protein IEE94_11075 [Yimella sp. cx-573]|nr:hypothetical protein [Yimella sp. cx-573]
MNTTTAAQAARITRALDPIRAKHRHAVDPAEPSVGIMHDHHYCAADDQDWPCDTARTIAVIDNALTISGVAS